MEYFSIGFELGFGVVLGIGAGFIVFALFFGAGGRGGF